MTTSEREAAAASRLMDMAIAHWGPRLILQAAEMSLADKFTGDAPRSAKTSPPNTACGTARLYRYLRALTGLGVLAFAGPDSFRLTDLGDALRTGAPGARALGLHRAGRRHGEAGVEGVRPWAVHRRYRVRESPRHGAVRLPAEQSGHGTVLQRDDGRVPRARAAGGGRGLRLLGHRQPGRRRRRLGQHARTRAVAASGRERCALRPAARGRRRTAAACGARRRRPGRDPVGQLLRERARRTRRLPAQPHHPRLGRWRERHDPRRTCARR